MRKETDGKRYLTFYPHRGKWSRFVIHEWQRNNIYLAACITSDISVALSFIAYTNAVRTR